MKIEYETARSISEILDAKALEWETRAAKMDDFQDKDRKYSDASREWAAKQQQLYRDQAETFRNLGRRLVKEALDD